MYSEYANCGQAEKELCEAADKVCIRIHLSDGEDFECKKFDTLDEISQKKYELKSKLQADYLNLESSDFSRRFEKRRRFLVPMRKIG